jgi:hypothetical protein
MKRASTLLTSPRLRLSCSAQRRCVYVDADSHDMPAATSGRTEERRTAEYPSHVPTSAVQKVLLAVGSTVGGLLDPSRGGKFPSATDQ